MDAVSEILQLMLFLFEKCLCLGYRDLFKMDVITDSSLDDLREVNRSDGTDLCVSACRLMISEKYDRFSVCRYLNRTKRDAIGNNV